MAEIFISYARDDRDTAHALAVALEAAGLAVWWDRELTGGGDFAAEIEHHLHAAPLVIVLWSRASVLSDFVRDESSRARDQSKLLPVRIDDVALPLGFGTLHTLDLLDWDGDADDEAWLGLLSQIRVRLQQATQTAPGERTSAAAGSRRVRATTVDPLTRRRIRRRWLIGLGAAGIAATAGIGWTVIADSRRERERERLGERKRAALAHLEKAFDHHFDADPPDLKKAELEYRLAAENDSTLAEAFFYWGHLTIALMDRKLPKPSSAELAGLREDALERFRQSLQSTALGRGQRAVAEEQIRWLAASEPAPVERSADTALVAALATTPQPTAAPTAARESKPPTSAAPVARPDPQPSGGLGAVTGGLLGAIGITGDRGSTATARPPAQPPPPSAAPAPAPAETPPGDHRLAAGAAVEQRAAAESEALFVDDRDRQIGARSLLAGNPQLAAEALPVVLAAARSSLAAPADPAGRSGVAATVQLVGNATPAVVQANRQAIEALQRGLLANPGRAPAGAAATLASALRRSEGRRPTVFVQIANARQAALARQLVQRFEAAGYVAAEIETVGDKRAPTRPEVRSHGGSDPAMARWCQAKLSQLVGSDVVLQNLRDTRPDNDVFEIWFDAALCAPGGREVAGCGPA